MDVARKETPAAVLVSGGLDSAVLTAELCDRHVRVFPLFIQGGLLWEAAELQHLQVFLRAIARAELAPLLLLDQPVRDVYGDHWSTTGLDVPDAQSPDGAVFLPGRNLFLVTKAAVWCVLHQVETLALGSLHANPFPDSTSDFDRGLEELVGLALGSPLHIARPFANMNKVDVVRRGAKLPLQWTFSCIRPAGGRHCGTCNKCAERRSGFAQAGLADPTQYAPNSAMTDVREETPAMYRVTREITFCYGHRLLNYEGKCRHLHGHNGKAVITLQADQLDPRGMVMDFAEIKQALSDWIDTYLDHKMLLHRDDPVLPLLLSCREPVFVMDANPTAESIARLIFDFAKDHGYPVVEVQLWETDTCCATYRAE